MASKRPNVLLITSDQQHFSTLGCVNDKIKTPALDRLAAEGTRFDRAYCNNPVCSPSRATMITGMYPAWHGCWTIGVKLPEDVPTVGEQFSAAGYATHLVGKAHFQPLASEPGSESLECQPVLRDLEFWRGFDGPWYGFDKVELARNHADESHVGQHYALWMEEKGLTNWRDYFQPVEGEEAPLALEDVPKRAGGYGRPHEPWRLPDEYHYSVWTAERTIANIEQAVAGGKPFFTWASFHDPHPPYVAPEPWFGMYDPDQMEPGKLIAGELERMPPPHRMTQEDAPEFGEVSELWAHGYHSHLHDGRELREDMAVYYGMISLMDKQIGRIVDALDELGVADDTIVVFTTDHGHLLGQHGLIAKGPFHYEDVIRLPFVVRWPGKVPAGRVSDAMQALVDLPSTFLSACGLGAPGQMQGVDQTGVWCGHAPAARDWVICENRHNTTSPHLRTFVTERYKLTLYRDRDWGELFDFQEDPGEVCNLFDDPGYAELKAALMHAFLCAEMQREPTRMPRIAGA